MSTTNINITNINGAKNINGVIPDIDGLMVLETSDILTSQEVIDLASIPLKADLVNGLVPANQLPSYVDDVLEYVNLASFPINGESGKIYIAIDTKISYRWSGSVYVDISTQDIVTIYNGDGTLTSNRIVNLDTYTLRFIDELSNIILDINANGELGFGGGASGGYKGHFSGRVGVNGSASGYTWKNTASGGKRWNFDSDGNGLALVEAGVNKWLGFFEGGLFAFGPHTAESIIDVRAGTALLAPLQLRSGVNLTTPKDGVFEYDGTALYFTTAGTRKNLLGIVPAVQTALDIANKCSISWSASDTSTALTVATSAIVVYSDLAMTITSVLISLGDVQASGSTFTVNIKKNGTTIFSTLATIDNAEYTTLTASVQPVLNGAQTLAIGDRITTEVTQIGNGTAKQLACSLIGTRL